MLESGFVYNVYDDKEKDLAKKRYDELSEYDKDFYNNVLPFVLMGAHVRHVSEATIPEIVLRERIAPILVKRKEAGLGGDEQFAEYLKKFIGFTSNVTFMPFDKYIKIVMDRHRQKSNFKKQKDVDKEHETYRGYWKNQKE